MQTTFIGPGLERPRREAAAVSGAALVIEQLEHRYGERVALAGVSFEVPRGEMFALLGPNGSGKSTLFRIVSTLMRPSGGAVKVFGLDLATQAAVVRSRIGVVFQRPAIDGKLSVRENLWGHARLYGLGGAALNARIDAMLERLGLAERGADRVDTLSGGLQRRVELAKGLLHEPALLLLDEPSTGLDPGARRDFNQYLRQLRDEQGVTVVLTTHYMEEAERSDRVGIMHEGKLVSLGRADELKAQVGGDVVVVQAPDPEGLRERIRARFHVEPQLIDGQLRIELPRGHEFVRELVDAFPDETRSVSFGKPTLEDVFIHRTGHRFWTAPSNGAPARAVRA